MLDLLQQIQGESIDAPHLRTIDMILLHHALNGFNALIALMQSAREVINDALANGAIQTLPADLTGKIAVTGQDADLGGIRNIISGKQSMTIYKPIKPLASMAAELAIKLAKGEQVHGKTKFQSSGLTVDAIFLDPVVVDKSNYNDTVVKDGHVKASEIIR